MTVVPLVPDLPPLGAAPVQPPSAAFGAALDAIAGPLERAERAEDAFAAKRGSLYDAVYERARADVALAVATSVAQHAAQAVQSVLNMQV